jgi:hypothetical protein
MLGAQHTYYDLKNANYEKIIHRLVSIEWYNALDSGSADHPADFLQKSLFICIRECVPLRNSLNYKLIRFFIWHTA